VPSPGAPAIKLADTPQRRVAVASAAALLAAEARAPLGLAVVGDGLRRPILGAWAACARVRAHARRGVASGRDGTRWRPVASPVHARARPRARALTRRASPSRVTGVTLRSETLDMRVREPRRSAWTSMTVLAPEAAAAAAGPGGARGWYRTLEYRTYCLDWRSGQVFAAYTNGAALYNRSRCVTRDG
jgi:hypothetical protein